MPRESEVVPCYCHQKVTLADPACEQNLYFQHVLIELVAGGRSMKTYESCKNKWLLTRHNETWQVFLWNLSSIPTIEVSRQPIVVAVSRLINCEMHLDCTSIALPLHFQHFIGKSFSVFPSPGSQMATYSAGNVIFFLSCLAIVSPPGLWWFHAQFQKWSVPLSRAGSPFNCEGGQNKAGQSYCWNLGGTKVSLLSTLQSGTGIKMNKAPIKALNFFESERFRILTYNFERWKMSCSLLSLLQKWTCPCEVHQGHPNWRVSTFWSFQVSKTFSNFRMSLVASADKAAELGHSKMKHVNMIWTCESQVLKECRWSSVGDGYCHLIPVELQGIPPAFQSLSHVKFH